MAHSLAAAHLVLSTSPSAHPPPLLCIPFLYPPLHVLSLPRHLLCCAAAPHRSKWRRAWSCMHGQPRLHLHVWLPPIRDLSPPPCRIASLFERGLAYVGADYLSHPLWQKYIEYESERKEWSRVASIYTRMLQIPLQQLDHYYQGYVRGAEEVCGV